MPPKRNPVRRPAPPPEAVAPAAPPESAPAIALPYPQGWWRVAGYFLAFFIPGAGLTLALLYWRGFDRRSLRFSRWCLALALAGALVAWTGGLLWSDLQNGESGIQPW